MTNKQLAQHVGKKLTVVRMKLYELGLSRYSQKERSWKPEEDDILVLYYKTTGDVQIAKMLQRSKGGVRKRRKTLGLERSIDEINKIVERNMTEFTKTSFKPGNKSKCNPAKAWETRRKRDAEPQEVILKRINHREKANFYRTTKQ